MADASKDFELERKLLKLIVRVRLDMEEEFAAGRKKRSFLWDEVLKKIKEKRPNLNISRDHVIRKFLNLMTTYRRIIARNKEAGKRATNWEYFHDFNRVYGTNYSTDASLTPVDKSFAVLNDIQCDPFDDSSTSLIQTKCEPYDSTPLNKVKWEPCDDSAESFLRASESPPMIYDTRHSNDPLSCLLTLEDDSNGTAGNEVKSEPCEDSLEYNRITSTEPPAKKRCNNELLKFLKGESKRKQKRHEDILAIKREKLQMEEKKIKVMLELKDVLEKATAAILR